MLKTNPPYSLLRSSQEEVLWNGGEVDLETHGMLIHYYGSRGRLEEGMRALEECHRLKGAVPKER